MRRIGVREIFAILTAVMIMTLNSCRVFYPDRLFKIDDEKLALADTLTTEKEYVLRTGDVLTLGVFSNNGYELVDVLSQTNETFSAYRYEVKQNGFIQLPMLDSLPVIGYTVKELEQLLQEKYNYYFVNPFIIINVTNRNVYVYRGRSGANVITLERENMNLLEVLAKAGGVPPGGKAYQVRILRGNLNSPTVFDIDLSTVEGMQRANLTMQADDVVYIESRLTSADVVYQITPALALISSLMIITLTIISLSQP